MNHKIALTFEDGITRLIDGRCHLGDGDLG